MPSNPHGEISPNDCFYHSDGKEAERASRPDDASDAEITIRTLHYLGEVSADAIRSYWHHNFMLDIKKPSLVAYEDMLKGRKTGNKKRDRLHDDCVAAYPDFEVHDDDSGSE